MTEDIPPSFPPPVTPRLDLFISLPIISPLLLRYTVNVMLTEVKLFMSPFRWTCIFSDPNWLSFSVRFRYSFYGASISRTSRCTPRMILRFRIPSSISLRAARRIAGIFGSSISNHRTKDLEQFSATLVKKTRPLRSTRTIRVECIYKYFAGLWYRSNQLSSVPVRLSQPNAAKLVWLTKGQTSKSTRLPVDSFQLFPGFSH